MSVVVEPGFWAAVILLWAAADLAVGAILSRSRFIELNAAARGAILSGHTDSYEDVRRSLRFASATFSPLVVGIIAPVFYVFLAVRIMGAKLTGQPLDQIRMLITPRANSHVDQLGFSALFRRSPTMAAWVTAWCFLPILAGLMFPRRSQIIVARRTVAAEAFVHVH